MIRFRRHRQSLLSLAMALAIAATGTVARAQDEEVHELGPDANVDARSQPRLDPLMFQRQLENWIFRQLGNAETTRLKLETTLALRVDDVARTCRLAPDQKKKLQVAGRGDIKRFFDRVEEAKHRIRDLKGPWNNVNINIVGREALSLQKELAATWFEDGSLFAKAVNHTLTQEQIAEYHAALRLRNEIRYRATARWLVVILGRSMGWSDEQRRRFEKLLLDQTRAPRNFGASDYFAVLYQASRLPEKDVKSIFDDLQWRLLSKQLQQARGMEQWLNNGGYVPDDRPAGAGDAMVRTVQSAVGAGEQQNPSR